MKLLPLMSLVLTASVAWCAPAELHVAPGGDDANDGSARAPFATLTRARDAIRSLKTDAGLSPGGVTVWVEPGHYRLAGRFDLTAEDSGTAEAPIVYRARPGRETVISGGVRVPARAFGPVASRAALGRLPVEARTHVVQADLKALGVEDYGSPGGGGLEVFAGEQRLTLARWPNQGFARIADVLNRDPVDVRGTKGDRAGIFVYEGDRPEHWIGEQDLWVHGYWFWDWADQRHRVTRIDRDDRTLALEKPWHSYGYRKGQWYYAYNALSELDSPGEWYLDREAGVLYLWPTQDLAHAPITVSVLDSLVEATDVTHVTFQGLTFEAARGTAVTISGSDDALIGCTFRMIGGFAAKALGMRQRIMHCDAYALGEGGFVIAGGDRPTLTPAGNVVENCHIHDFGEVKRMYVPAVSVSGVGNRVAHNLIHDAPHQAIAFSGNDHLFELNEIHSVCYESNDAGAIYAGRDWTMRGTVIRYNYMHHVNGREGRGVVGVYLDDMFCGAEIVGNVFYRVIRAAFVGGGRDCLIANNIFAECPRAIHIDARAMGWAAASVPTTMTTRLNEMPFRQPPWSERYPQLLTILDDEPAAPKSNVVARNVVVGAYPWRDVEGRAAPYQTIEDPLVIEDPAAFDPRTLALRLPAGAELPEGFESIPVGEIGLYRDENRPTWPGRTRVRPSVAYYWRTVQEASLRPAAQARPARPRPEFLIERSAGAVQIDGRLRAEEWAGLRRERAMPIAEGIEGEATPMPSRAWLVHDGAALLIGIENEVDAGKPLRPGDTWGQDDAVEIALRRPNGPILVLRGFPSGHFVSSDEAGAPATEVARAAEGTQYAATVVDAGHWTCEWRIPFAALGITPDPALRLDFNISARKSAQPLWQMWRGTGAHTWDVQSAGMVRFSN